jgi:Concanavalin A-like lectin/glucanases superfamily
LNLAHGLLREPLSRQKLLNLKPMSIPFKSKVFCPCGRLLVVHYSGLLLVLLWLLAGIPVQATVTTVDYWRMGENDPSDTPGFATTTTDPVGGNTIALSGGPFYATVNSSTATADASSSSCMQFFTGTYGLAPLIPGLTNNFGVEFWVNPSATPSSACLVYNGNSGSSGWGIYQNGSTYKGLLGGNAFVGLATATAGTWVHLALVVSNGTAMLFANGTLAGPTASAVANPATGANIGFAANPNNTSQDQFGGYLDEVRVFTFVPGQFSTNDFLLYGGLPLVTVNAATLVAANNAQRFGQPQRQEHYLLFSVWDNRHLWREHAGHESDRV